MNGYKIHPKILSFHKCPHGAVQVSLDITPDEGGFYGVCRELPGVVSQGDTLDECVENVKEALAGVLETYASLGEPIPWNRDVDPPERWPKPYCITVETIKDGENHG